MSEQPRLSRRQMREQGLLRPISDGPSPIEELSLTQEIHLRRPSRKELRLREQSQEESRPLVREEVTEEPSPTDVNNEEVQQPQSSEVQPHELEQGEAHQNESQLVDPIRKSVFDRFQQPQESSSASQGNVDQSAADENNADEQGNVTASLQSQLLSRMKQSQSEQEGGHEGHNVPASLSPEAQGQFSHVEAVAPVPFPVQSSMEEEAEETQPKKPRTWLMYALALPIGAILGLLLGLALRMVLFSEGASILPSVHMAWGVLSGHASSFASVFLM